MTNSSTLLAASFVALALVGCGGSSGDNDDDSSGASFAGTVVDAVNGAPLEGVTIGTDGGSVSSFNDGRFELGELILSDAPFIRFALGGYREEQLANPTLGDGFPGINPNPTLGSGGSAFDTIALVPDDLAGSGGLAGAITDADGQAVVGATLRFLRGIFVTEGEADAVTTTSAGGDWSVTGLPYGNYTCIILIPGQDPIYQIVQVYGGVDRADQDVTVPASQTSAPPAANPLEPGPGEIRIELDYFGIYGYRPQLITPDGRVIDSDSTEVTSGEIRYGGTGDASVVAFALSLEQAEGLTFRVFRRLGLPGSQLSRNDVDVRVIGPDGVIAMFEVPEMRTGQWTVFRVTNGQIVEITEEPDE